jgi:hypothetical protein
MDTAKILREYARVKKLRAWTRAEKQAAYKLWRKYGIHATPPKRPSN